MGRSENMDELSPVEQKAVAALRRVARQWPRSLTLASMDGELVVIRTGDPRFLEDGTGDRQEAIIADIPGIPNTGGAW